MSSLSKRLVKKKIIPAIFDSIYLLKTYGRTENGFYPQIIGQGEAVAPSTANCIDAIQNCPNIKREYIKEAIDDLFSLQISSGRNAYSWCANERSSVWATAKSLNTIIDYDLTLLSDKRVKESISWLSKQYNSHNNGWGWGYQKNSPSRPFYTYFVLNCFLKAYKANPNRDYFEIIKNIGKYLLKSQIEIGIWSNGSDNIPCAGNTAMALVGAKKIESTMQCKILDNQTYKVGSDFVEKTLNDQNNWLSLQWSEPVIAMDIQFFPSGKVNELLQLFPPEHPLISKLINWLLENRTTYRASSALKGWKWPPTETKEETPYTWSTALAVKSLVSYISYQGVDIKLLKKLPVKTVAYDIALKHRSFKKALINPYFLAFLTIIGVVIGIISIL